MGKYDAQARTAHSLLSRKGTTVTFTRENPRAFDPVTQQETPAAITTLSMPGMGISPNKSAEFRIGSLERRNIIEFHLAPRGGAVPQPGDKVRWGGFDWSVIWVNDTDPAADGAPYALAYAER